jgi:hypothetical protein
MTCRLQHRSARLRCNRKGRRQPRGPDKVPAESFLKEMQSKDVPAVAKAFNVPFLRPDIKAKQPKFDRLENAGALAVAMKPLVEETGSPAAVGEVQSLAALKEKVGDCP